MIVNYLSLRLVMVLASTCFLGLASPARGAGDYPAAPSADACGGGPGDPPIFTFAPGSAIVNVDNPTDAGRLRRWRKIIRPNVKLVLLRGVADTSEPGYTADLGLRRAQAVRDLLISLGIAMNDIWVKGDSLTPATPLDHEAIFARVVTISDPSRAIDCDQMLYAARFRWFTGHCSGQTVDAPTQKTCDLATEQLGGGDTTSKAR